MLDTQGSGHRRALQVVCGTRLASNPSSSSSLASSVVDQSIALSARAVPTRRGSQNVPPPSGMRPMSTTFSCRYALVLATRRSQARGSLEAHSMARASSSKTLSVSELRA